MNEIEKALKMQTQHINEKTGVPLYPNGMLYVRQCSYDANIYNVFVRGNKNEFDEPYCVLPAVTYEQAEQFVREHDLDAL